MKGRGSRVLMARSCPPLFTVTCVALACSLIACPIPARHTAQVTPSVIGTLHRSDGSPVAGAPVAVTRDERDVSCREAGARTLTDSIGRFRLPEVSVQKRIFWFTMFESFGMTSYWLCAGASDSTPGVTSRRRTMIRGHVSGDSVACLEWNRPAEVRLTCNSPGARQIVTGGTWTDGSGHGSYRVILVGDEPWEHDSRV